MRIRETRTEDFAAVQALYLHLHETEPLGETEQARTLWQRLVQDPDYHILVGEQDGRLVSSVTLVVIPNLTRGMRPYALIENVVTDAAYRGRGCASALMGEAVRLARLAGCYKAMLLTGSKKPETLRFYERCGFNERDKTAFIRWL